MVYETSRLLAEQSYQDWITNQLFSLGWFLQVGLLIAVYTVWLIIADKSRIKDLLLFGSLFAVAFALVDSICIGFLGLWEFTINLLPFQPPFFIVGFTIGPIVHMIALQYSSAWPRYVLLSGVGSALIVFVILPIYAALGILQMHNWNYFYHYLLFLFIATTARWFYMWFTGIEQRHPRPS